MSNNEKITSPNDTDLTLFFMINTDVISSDRLGTLKFDRIVYYCLKLKLLTLMA